MWETSARLLRLLSLLQTRRDWSGAELAERLEITPRTVRRDIDRLRGLGYQCWPPRARRLPAGSRRPAPLLLDDDEAVAVAMGLRTAAGGSITGIEETSVRALAKLEQVLPSRLRHRINALQSVTVPMANTGPTSTRAPSPPSPPPAATPACASTTAPTTEPAASARPSRTGWCTRAGAGTSSAGTSTAGTGAPTAWTASTRARPPAPGSLRAPARPRHQRLHLAGDLHVGLPLPGPVHPARQRRDRGGRIAPASVRWSRSTSTAAPCGRVQLAGRVGHLRDNQGSTSRCTNPRSCRARQDAGSPARRRDGLVPLSGLPGRHWAALLRVRSFQLASDAAKSYAITEERADGCRISL